MTLGKKGEALMHFFEGCRLEAYPDPASGGDPWTIGWGDTGPDVVPGLKITQEEADARFRRRVEEFAKVVRECTAGSSTNQNQFDAFVSFTYNCGPVNFSGSTMLKKHKAGDFIGAAAEFDKWVRAAGKVMPGLVKRRAAERALYEDANV